MNQLTIAKTLKQAAELGPEHTADLLRQKLTVLLYQLQLGMDPEKAIKDFQENIGMDEIPVSSKKAA
jgi:hypothetical protein